MPKFHAFACLSVLSVLLSFGCGSKPPVVEGRRLPTEEDRQRNGAQPTTLEQKPDPKSAADEKPTGPPVVESPKPLDDALLADGWIALFDGETLFGCEATSDADWKVEDGAIVVSSGERGLLATTTQFANYALHLEFKAAEGANSGIFLRTPEKPTAPATDCYELNIAPKDNPFPTGSLVGRQKVEGDFSSTDWQTYDVTVNGESVVVQLDGKEILNYKDAKPLTRGFIGLQLNEGKVAFRDVRLKPLGGKPLFNGKDLEGWSVPESPSEFVVRNPGELNVRNGRGHIETEESFGDFVLQLECISHAKHLNSGIFFRCVPGSAMDGYESQIQNEFNEGHRRLPADHGTGGIFRRQNARLVVADDLKWFQKTIVADGPHMAVWVNGYQVSDWTDTREPNENPRRGLRTSPGSIMIQGHDPTTDLSFRKMQISDN